MSAASRDVGGRNQSPPDGDSGNSDAKAGFAIVISCQKKNQRNSGKVPAAYGRIHAGVE
jgi:hypothetical protein